MAGSRAVQQWKEAMAPGGGDSDDEEMMKEECKKNLKLVKKMKKDLAVSGKGEGEIEWQRDSDVQHTQWGVDFGFQRGMLMGIGINGGIGYQSRSEKRSTKGKAKFTF